MSVVGVLDGVGSALGGASVDGLAVGLSDGLSDGEGEGVSDGEGDGLSDGEAAGLSTVAGTGSVLVDGVAEGDSVGAVESSAKAAGAELKAKSSDVANAAATSRGWRVM